MKLVVVGGQARKVGKTSVIAGLIRGLNMLAWTAVKVSHHTGDAASQDGPSADELPPHHDFFLSEERDAKGHGDTSLYLAAGARRALWLRTREGGLARVLPSLLEALEGDEHVIVESNSLLGFLKPAVFLMVIDESVRDLKASARQFSVRADAFVAVRSDRAPSARPVTSLRVPDGKPVFSVSVGDWSNPTLCGFVGERLACTTEEGARFHRSADF
jgi:molybdopterin-guanine dinucleotide biosynthesis protein